MTVNLVRDGVTVETFSTLASAVAASQDGDTVQLQAGVYVNDFANVTTQITIEGVGGMARLVATDVPDNGRAILRTTTDVVLENLDISGATDASGNGAGVLAVGGNLTMLDCYVHDNQDGLLAASDVAAVGTIAIENSEFADNGSGDGYTHNIYVNANGGAFAGIPDTLLIENSFIHDVLAGQEVKSRADTTVITGSTITDGSAGTGSYDIDVPNGGTVTLTGDLIEKGPDSPNKTLIHFGGDSPLHAGSTLTLSDNVIASAIAGLTPVLVANNTGAANVTDSDNQLYGVAGSAADTTLDTPPAVVFGHPWEGTLDFLWAGGAGPQRDPNDAATAANWLLVSNGTTAAAGSVPLPGDTMRIGDPAADAFTLELAAAPATTTQLTGNTVAVGGNNVRLDFTDVALDADSTITETTTAISTMLTVLGTLDNAGTIAADSSDGVLTVALAAGSLDNTGLLQAVAGGTLWIDGGTLSNAGLLLADGGTLRIAASLPGSGAIVVADGAAELSGAVPDGQTVLFADAAGTLELDDAGAFDAAILGMQARDTIILPGVAPDTVTLGGFDPADPDTLLVTSGSLSAALRFPGAGLDLAAFAPPQDDGDGGTAISLAGITDPLWTASASGRLTANWSDAAQWSTGIAPGAGDIAVIAAAATASYTVMSADQSVGSVILAAPQGTLLAEGTLSVAGAITDAAGRFAVGAYATATLENFTQTGAGGDLELQPDSTLTLTGDTGLALQGTGTIVNATLAASGTLQVGADASLFVYGGNVAAAASVLDGSLVIDGTDWTDTNSMQIGNTGNLRVEFGSVLTDNGDATLGGTTGADGIAVVAGNARWTIAGDLDIGLAGSASVSATLDGTSAGQGPGAIAVGGDIALGAGGTLSVTSGSAVTAAALAMQAGSTITVDGGSLLQIGASGSTYGGVAVDAGATLEGAGLVAAAIADAGTIAASDAGATLDLAGSLDGTGVLAVAPGAILQLDAPVAAGLSVDFAPGTATLALTLPGAMQAAVQDFGIGSTIDLPTLTFSTLPSDPLRYANGTLGISDGGASPFAAFPIGDSYQPKQFVLRPDAGTGTAIVGVACFCAGTRIATPEGERPIETLGIGDRVLTASGTARRVRWLGRRRYPAAVVAGRPALIPVRIGAGALGSGLPRRDLLVSPLHALLIDGVLMPAVGLVNGVSIVRAREVTDIAYFHIELASHDVILAEGTPAETYLDCGNRGMFEAAAPYPGLPFTYGFNPAWITALTGVGTP